MKFDRNFSARKSTDLIVAQVTVRYLLNEIEIGARTHNDMRAPAVNDMRENAISVTCVNVSTVSYCDPH